MGGQEILTSCTVMLNECGQFVSVWCKIGFRSFQRGTEGYCRSKGYKVTTCQSWRFEKLGQKILKYDRKYFKRQTLSFLKMTI